MHKDNTVPIDLWLEQPDAIARLWHIFWEAIHVYFLVDPYYIFNNDIILFYVCIYNVCCMYICVQNHVRQVEQAEGAEVAAELNRMTFQLAMASNRTDENTSSYPADLMTANSLLEFSLKYVYKNYVTKS